jgi:hypothetical protein
MLLPQKSPCRNDLHQRRHLFLFNFPQNQKNLEKESTTKGMLTSVDAKMIRNRSSFATDSAFFMQTHTRPVFRV